MIYADYNGSAPLLPEVREYLLSRLSSGPYANPSSIHSLGQKINLGINKCRSLIANILGSEPEQIIFTSSASESISQIFHSVLSKSTKKIIISSELEHAAVIEALNFYSESGYQIKFVKTLKSGEIDLNHLKELAEEYKDSIALVTIMAANNETGVIQPYSEIGKIAHESGAQYFSDTTQIIAKSEFDFNKSNIDFAVASSHKMGALVGAGILLTKEVYNLKSIIFGGGQEKNKRGGTENYIAIESMAVALQVFEENKSNLSTLSSLKLKFEKNISMAFPQIQIIGTSAQRLACTSLISFPGIHGQAVQIELEAQDIFVTTSSACGDNEPETSHVLKAMGIDDSIGRGVIRISLSSKTSADEFGVLEQALNTTYRKLNLIQNY